MSDLFGAIQGPPSRWIAHDGKPAACLGDIGPDRCGGAGWPSYEQDDGTLVFDLLICFEPALGHGPPRLFSRWYGAACMLAPDGMVPVHKGATPRIAFIGEYDGERAIYELDQPHAETWRPLVYERSSLGWSALGSQGELQWRDGLKKATIAKWITEDPSRVEQLEERFGPIEELSKMLDADDRAQALLRECLSPQQLLELVARNGFRVRGGKTGNVYGIEIGNGFTLLTKDTCETVVSYCLHPEYWMPHADVALATKLALEDPDLEVDTVEGAKASLRQTRLRANREERYARDIEKELIA